MLSNSRTDGVNVGDDQILKPLYSDSTARIWCIKPDRPRRQQLGTVIADQVDREMHNRQSLLIARVAKLSREQL